VRTIQVQPSRKPRWQKQGGWEAYEVDDVSPTFCGPNAREDAFSYARQRAGHAPTEIRVLDNFPRPACQDRVQGAPAAAMSTPTFITFAQKIGVMPKAAPKP